MNKNKALTGAVALMLFSFGLKAQNPYMENSLDLDEVVISSSRMGTSLKKMPQKVEVITENDIKGIPVNNVADLLKTLANVDVLQYPGANASIGMRGFKPSSTLRGYTLLLIDGKPAGTTNIATIPTAFVEKIEVIKGPYSVLYGSDAMGGIVNVITKKVVNGTHASVGVGFGSFGSSNMNASINMKPLSNFGFSFAFSRDAQDKDYTIGKNNIIKDEKYERDLLVDKSYGDKMECSRTATNNFGAKVSYDINDKWNMELTELYSFAPEIFSPGGYLKTYSMNKIAFARTNTSLDIRRISDNNTLTISPYYSYNDRTNYSSTDATAGINLLKKQHEYGVKVSDMHRWGIFSLAGGVDVDRFVSLSEKYSKGKLTAPYTPDYDIFSSSLFVQGNVDWKGLFVNAGVRYNLTRFGVTHNEFLKNEAGSKLFNNVCPSLGLRYDIIPEISVHASTGIGYYIPDAYQVAGQYESFGKKYVGNPNLKPETSNSVDAGVSFSRNNWFNADVTYFYTVYKDKIVEDNSKTGYVTYVNAPSANMSGIEAMVSWDILKMLDMRYSLSLYANYTYMINNKYKEPKKDNRMLDLLYVRKNMANFGANFDFSGRFGARLNGRFIGNRLESNWFADKDRPWDVKNYYTQGGYTEKDKIIKHPNHLVFDMSAYYNVNDMFRFGISVSNLFDENYSEKDGYNMPGRCVMGTLSFNINQ